MSCSEVCRQENQGDGIDYIASGKVTMPKRLYDDKRRKRQVFVSITSWRGVSVGAKHFYAKVYEDENPLFCNLLRDGYVNERGHWRYDSEDKDCEGREFGGIMDTSFDTFDSALDWVIDIINEYFPTSTHKLFDVSGGLITFNQLSLILHQKQR